MAKRVRRRVPTAFDQASSAQAVAVPGIDPRTWVSMGLVVGDEEEDDPPVVFDEEEGQVFVQVQLEPSKLPAFCRVAAGAAGPAGAGEGEYAPFMRGDEVVVLMPNGNAAGAVIIGRLNNALDKFPMESVAGQDPTTNSFAFRRRRTPFVEEYAGPVLFRSALSEAFISIDEGGVFTVRATDGVALQMGPDAFQFQGPQTPDSPPEYILQMDMDGEHFLVQVKDAIISIGSSTSSPDQNTISVPRALTLGTAGNATEEHVLTTEAFVNLLGHMMLLLSGAIAALPSPVTSPALAALFVDPAFTALVAPALAAAAAGPSAGYSTTALAVLAAAFQGQPQKTASGGVAARPGIGCSGLLVG